jgi:hypothetical protein
MRARCTTAVKGGPGETWGCSGHRCRQRKRTRREDPMTKKTAETHWKTAILKTLFAALALPALLAPGCSTGGTETGA